MSIVGRMVYLMCDHICKLLGISLIPGKHVPAFAVVMSEELYRPSSRASSVATFRTADTVSSLNWYYLIMFLLLFLCSFLMFDFTFYARTLASSDVPRLLAKIQFLNVADLYLDCLSFNLMRKQLRRT